MNKKFKKSQAMACAVLAVAIVVACLTGANFKEKRNFQGDIVAGPGVTSTFMLSDYNENLVDTYGDTKVYVLEGEEPGGSFLVLGGTHANEPAAHMAAVTLLENAVVQKGTLYVIPTADASGFSHNDPQEASPQYYHFTLNSGEEVTFAYGSRATNPIDQWPDPDVYTHYPSGQSLSGSETRNLNRGYPGVADGNLTERMCYAITQLIKENDITMEMDLHEASPEYPTINATVAHERAMGIASEGILNVQLAGIRMSLEPSPANLHGLTHRELGDFTDTYALLMETGNPSQGRLRGATNEALVLTGKDPCYVKAAELGFLYIPYDENGVSIEERAGRHLQGCIEYINALNENVDESKQMIVSNIPTYDDLMNATSLGEFLLSPTAS